MEQVGIAPFDTGRSVVRAAGIDVEKSSHSNLKIFESSPS